MDQGNHLIAAARSVVVGIGPVASIAPMLTLRDQGSVRSVPVGTVDKVISLRAQNLPTKASNAVNQIEMPCPPDLIMRRLYADREEKRVTRGAT
jgi:hypothetical protein